MLHHNLRNLVGLSTRIHLLTFSKRFPMKIQHDNCARYLGSKTSHHNQRKGFPKRTPHTYESDILSSSLILNESKPRHLEISLGKSALIPSRTLPAIGWERWIEILLLFLARVIHVSHLFLIPFLLLLVCFLMKYECSTRKLLLFHNLSSKER